LIIKKTTREEIEMSKTNTFQVFAIVLLGSGLMSAQATLTWVSGVGNDNNPCSRTAPCQTFAGAIAKTVAGGEIDALDPGAFGAVTINKAITIDGGGGQAAVLVSNATNGIVVQAGTNDVITVRNLRINGVASGTNGIRFLAGKELHVEHCSIYGFANAGIDIEPSAGGKIFIDDTISADNAFAGLFVQAGTLTPVDVYRSRFQANGIHGIWASSNSNVSVRESDASGNGGEGFIAAANAGTAELNLTNSTANNNVSVGVQAGYATLPGIVRVSGVSLSNNGAGFSIASNGLIKSFGNNSNSGSGTPSSGQGIPQQ
jgi:hypothetical protein